MFQAAVALLLARGITFDPKQHLDHTLVRSLFSNHFIHRRKDFAGKYESYLYDALIIRGLADYHSEIVSQKKAKQQLLCAEEFARAIREEMSHA